MTGRVPTFIVRVDAKRTSDIGTYRIVAAVLVGMVDTMGRVLLPVILRSFMGQAAADGAGPALASMMVYILMSLVLVFKPTGLFPPKG